MLIKPTKLDITYTGDNRYILRILVPGKPFAGPMEEEWNIHIRHDLLKKLCGRMDREAQKVNIQVDLDHISPFVKLGRILHEQVIPRDKEFERLRETLSTIETPLLISTNDPAPIWELLHDGDGFFATKYAVSRCLRKSTVPSNLPAQERDRQSIIIANPTEDLPETGQESRKLLDWLTDRGIVCEFLEGKQATQEEILTRLSEREYDIIHYSGHMDMESQVNECAFRLSGGDLLSATEVRRSVKGAPLVFLNGCRSADSVEGMACAFLEAGARLVIGTIFKVPDAGARRLAERFYELALGGESVGQALRIARKEVMDESSLRATWASFIMYGDPCLRLDYGFSVDGFLKRLGFTRQNFEASCLRVVEEAICFSQTGGVLTTLHLFAAMLGGEDSQLRDYLKIQKTDLAKLKEEFEKASERKRGDSKSSEVECSPNVRRIVSLAQSRAVENGRDRISERDLLAAFVDQGGGTTGEILRHLGVRINLLTEKIPDAWIHDIVSKQDTLGPLSKKESDPACWDIAIRSMEKALSTGSSVVGTPHLFSAMLEAREARLAKALRRCAIPPDQMRLLFERIMIPKGPSHLNKNMKQVPCSENVSQVLLRAKELSSSVNKSRIMEADLLTAFIGHGGGEAGKILRKAGIDISVLETDLLSEDGRINLDRFDDNGKQVLLQALSFAREEKHSFVTTLHLFLGLTSLKEGLTRSFLVKKGLDPSDLMNTILRLMKTDEDREVDDMIDLRASFLSQRLIGILGKAAELSRSEQDQTITEKHLLQAFVSGAGQEVKEILSKLGFALGRIERSIDR